MVAAEEDGALPASSCLSIFGLAHDAHEREVHVLFSACPGYMRCVLQPGKSATQRPYAFVQFADQESALAAHDSREGTTWEEGGNKIGIEFAKRDIPEKFKGQRQREPAYDPAYAPAHYGQPPPPSHYPPAQAYAPAAKRPRRDDYGGANSQSDGSQRTLHVGGLPKGLYQPDLDAFLTANFPVTCMGGTLSGRGGDPSFGRAFVGFNSNRGAQEAFRVLDGFDWDGAILRVEWARSEWKALTTSGAGGSQSEAYSQPPPRAQAWQAPRGGGYDDWGGGKSGKSGKGGGGGGGKGGGGGASRTLHFTNLPPISQEEFENFIHSTFSGMVEVANFKDTHDGRPPVAWVLFVDENAAGEIASSHANFDWNDTRVRVAYARTDLDPGKFRK